MRQPGFYWVRDDPNGWIVARWDGKHWWITAHEGEWQDEDFEQIDPRPIEKKGP